MKRNELDKLIHILIRRCRLVVTEDHATNIMTYSEWLDDVINEMDRVKYDYPKTPE
jgi:hypothetical protein